MSSSVARFLDSNWREIRFFGLFAIFFLLAQGVYYILYVQVEEFIMQTLNAQVVAWILSTLTDVRAVAHGAVIRAGWVSLKIAQGCDGVDGLLLLWSAMLAYPVSLKKRLLGLLGGTLFLYVINLLRIIGLYYTYKNWPSLFDTMHLYVGQTLFILMALLCFILWATLAGRKPAAVQPEGA